MLILLYAIEKTMPPSIPQPRIHAIPTHIIFGFLGAGKTTLLNQLLAQKPAHETWAVLMNEAGKTEVDQGFLAPAKQSENTHVGRIAIKQLISGCMCCTGQVSMQVALSRLLLQTKPDRLFIEATGLGHPAQLIRQLSSTYWATALSLQAVLTVIDATNLHDARLLNHEIFQAQVSNADLIVLSHADVMQPKDDIALQHVLQQDYYKHQPVLQADHGNLLFEKINLPHQVKPERQQISYVKIDGSFSPSIT